MLHYFWNNIPSSLAVHDEWKFYVADINESFKRWKYILNIHYTFVMYSMSSEWNPLIYISDQDGREVVLRSKKM